MFRCFVIDEFNLGSPEIHFTCTLMLDCTGSVSHSNFLCECQWFWGPSSLLIEVELWNKQEYYSYPTDQTAIIRKLEVCENTIGIYWSQFFHHLRERNQGAGWLDGMNTTSPVHVLFRFMMFIIWEHSFNLLCLTDFKRNNKYVPCLLHKDIREKCEIFRMVWKVLHRTYNCHSSYYYHHYDSHYKCES